MEPETNQAVAEHDPVAEREKLELAGRDQINRFLGNPTGQAHDMARDLTDDELQAIKAANDRSTVKDVLTRAYDRRREAHEKQAKEDQERLKGHTTRVPDAAADPVSTDPDPPAN